MSNLETILTQRRDSLQRERRIVANQLAELKAQLAAIDQEIIQIDTIFTTMEMVNGIPQLERQVPKSQPTIKQAVLQVLEDHPNGLTAIEILREVNERFELGIVRTSLSPQLSRLKQAAKIRNVGIVWKLATPTEPNTPTYI